VAKQPTPQGISALLRKAGHKRSMSSKSRIKGMTERSESFMSNTTPECCEAPRRRHAGSPSSSSTPNQFERQGFPCIWVRHV
jgi:hypothetical protein